MKSHWIYCSVFCFRDSSVLFCYSPNSLILKNSGNAVIHSTVDEHLGCFQSYSITNGGTFWLFSYLSPDAHMKHLTKEYLPGLEHLSQKGHPSLALPVLSSYSSKSFKFTLLPAMCKSSSCFTLLPKLGIHSFIYGFTQQKVIEALQCASHYSRCWKCISEQNLPKNPCLWNLNSVEERLNKIVVIF